MWNDKQNIQRKARIIVVSLIVYLKRYLKCISHVASDWNMIMLVLK
jgi:hypothetical protein